MRIRPHCFLNPATPNQGETARASWESTHRLFAIGQLNLPEKLSLTSQFDASSGTPYNVVTGMDNNGDGVFQRPPFAHRTARHRHL